MKTNMKEKTLLQKAKETLARSPKKTSFSKEHWNLLLLGRMMK